MSRRTAIRLEDVAAIDNLAAAFWRAARGKRRRPDVRAFEAWLDRELAALAEDILAGSVVLGAMRVFEIRDPKLRTIHAPVFRERVLHHALMALVGPLLERSLVDDTFACRPGKGTLAAVRRAQRQCRRFTYFAKLDARAYFASIDHEVLRSLLRRRLKGDRALDLLDRIIASHEAAPGRGLPIGALTSQHFANLYLGELDRALLEGGRIGLVRYMDDIVVWGRSPGEVRERAEAGVALAGARLKLEVKPGWEVLPVERGVPLCGFRVYPDRLLLSRRRRRRYRRARRRRERAYSRAWIGAPELQAGYSAALAIVAHARSLAWRRRELAVRPAPDAWRYDPRPGRGHQGSNRVIRGGSWNSNAQNVRAAYRNLDHPSNRWNDLGFRLAREQTRDGGPTPDPAGAPSARSAALDPIAGGEHRFGRRRAGRAADAAAKARRRSDSFSRSP